MVVVGLDGFVVLFGLFDVVVVINVGTGNLALKFGNNRVSNLCDIVVVDPET